MLPGRKQIFRREHNGQSTGDVIAKWHEVLEGRPLLTQVMAEGRRMPGAEETLDSARRRAARELAQLPADVTGIAPAAVPYPVIVSDALQADHAGVRWASGGKQR